MTTKEKLREVIIKSCPELLDLSFGCEVKIFGSDEIVKLVSQIDHTFLLSNGKYHFGEIKNKDNYEPIIGHAIQLPHVLRAIEHLPYNLWSNGDKGTCVMGTTDGHNVRYDLTQDFDHQSEEFYNWLAGVLVRGNYDS